jgi:acetyl-CoA carboxylase biotin carboxyl carrier protein
LDFKEIKQIVELMDKHGLSAFELDRDGNRLSLKKATADPGAAGGTHPPQSHHSSARPAGPPATADESPGADEPEAPTIKSPMVGTFYRKPSPDAPAFVSVGDEVKEDTVICIVEAMKVMNEIKAEAVGKITRVLVDDASPVQYGEPLFEFAPA